MEHWRNKSVNKKIFRDKWQLRSDTPKFMWHSKSSSEREVYGNKILSQERWKTQISKLFLHLKHLEKEEQTKTKISRRKNTKIRAETNDMEKKETIWNINEIRSWFLEKINEINKPLSRLIKKKKGEPSNQYN